MVPLPFWLYCSKSRRLVKLQESPEIRTQSRHELIPIKISTSHETHRCPLLVNLIAGLHIYIDPNPQDNVADISGIPYQLKQYPCNLSITDQHIVGPFQTCLLNPHIMQSVQDGQPYDETQPFYLSHTAINTQHQTVIEIFRKRTDPLSAATTATSRLPLSQNQERCRHSALYGAQRFSIGGVDGVENMNRPFARFLCINLDRI
ncbi:hypothetical protein FBY06_1611 [Pseudomonas sp. SJZ085]|nr:hypothetical protein FBY00_1772 [Pseudomonas sp. SJZ075]TWC10828.1 hypothetical protein FBX99_1611 [Pseudomonas sp. SJZ074]TWC26824.1 hypothetical protein FBY02_14453 [Pseudomonas sp. SJZ078]TWC28866.1 hypothetical protein FBY06_1611 [Pseudomonas sp. SJZ085]TWC43785.1 hypothetical protein FBY11_1782 [Pseudomonas sp. SJZ124]TWC79065.1 hypothetical protein FBY09_1777 [Pseudomonas sp. SJZ101]